MSPDSEYPALGDVLLLHVGDDLIMTASDVPRTVLPIPERVHVGLTTYDAKDPDTSFPPIEPLRPPAGAPNVLIILLDDIGFGASSAFGGPCATPNAERLAATRPEVQPVPHHGAVRADPAGAADRAATTTRSGMGASPRSRRPHPVTARCAPTTRRRSPRR